MKKINSLLFLCLLLILAASKNAQAAGELTIHLPEKIQGVTAKVYYLGDYQGEDFIFVDSLASLQEEGKDWTKDDFQQEAIQAKIIQVLESQAIEPTGQAQSNPEGLLSLDLKGPGAYGVLYDKHRQGTTIYQHRPSFFYYVDGAISFEPKVDTSEEESHQDLQVIKVWFGDQGVQRPQSIHIQLYEDGQPLASRELTAQDYWRTSFTGLDPEKTYTVVEDLPPGYQASLDKREGIIYLQNTYQGVDGSGPNDPKPPLEPNPPTDPDQPVEPQPPADPDQPVEPNPPTDPDQPDPPDQPGPDIDINQPGSAAGPGQKLPQTGQVWWPLPLFLGAGLLFLILSRRQAKKDD